MNLKPKSVKCIFKEERKTPILVIHLRGPAVTQNLLQNSTLFKQVQSVTHNWTLKQNKTKVRAQV